MKLFILSLFLFLLSESSKRENLSKQKAADNISFMINSFWSIVKGNSGTKEVPTSW